MKINIDENEPELRPEYIKKLKKIAAGPHVSYDSMDAWWADVEQNCTDVNDLDW
jgi:hypothetical protein